MSLLSELPPGLTGLEQLRALIAAGRQPPIHGTLGIALVSADEGFVVIEAEPGPQHINPGGTVHGGFLATILDSACGCATHSALKPNMGLATLEIKVSFHRAVTEKTGKVRAEGRVLSISRRAAFTEAKLTDANGKLLASATSSLILTQLGDSG